MSENIISSNFRTMKDDATETTFRYPVETVKGDKGDKGEKGEPGLPALFDETVEVETLDPEETASATIEQTDEEKNRWALALKIPQGVKGEQGEKGETGETGYTPKIEKLETITLTPEQPASVTVLQGEKNPQDLQITVGIPQGKTGVKGEQGAKGLPALVDPTVEVETLNPDQKASASTVLTDPTTNLYRFSFKIPQGVKGDTPPTPGLNIGAINFVDDETAAKCEIVYIKETNTYEGTLTLPRFKGESGDNGVSPTFIGAFDDLGEIQATPTFGNLCTVRTDNIDELYFYDGKQWQKMARLTGEKGEKGDPGEPGKDGAKGDPGAGEVVPLYFANYMYKDSSVLADYIVDPDPEKTVTLYTGRTDLQPLAVFTNRDQDKNTYPIPFAGHFAYGHITVKPSEMFGTVEEAKQLENGFMRVIFVRHQDVAYADITFRVVE